MAIPDNLVPVDVCFNSETSLRGYDEAEFVLDPPLRNVVGYSINQVGIPFTYYVVDHTNNHFRIIQRQTLKAQVGVVLSSGTTIAYNLTLPADVTGPAELANSDGWNTRTIDVEADVLFECYLEPGTYTPDTLKYEFKKAVNLASPSKVSWGLVNATYNPQWNINFNVTGASPSLVTYSITSLNINVPKQERALTAYTQTEVLRYDNTDYLLKFDYLVWLSPTVSWSNARVPYTATQLSFVEPTNFEFRVEEPSLRASFYHYRNIATDAPIPFFMDFSEDGVFNTNGTMYELLGFMVTPPTDFGTWGKFYASSPQLVYDNYGKRVMEGRVDIPYLNGYDTIKLTGSSMINVHSNLNFASNHRTESDQDDVIFRVPISGVYGSLMSMPGNAEMIPCSRDELTNVRFYLSLGHRKQYIAYDKASKNVTGKRVGYLPLNGWPFQIYLRLYCDDGKVPME